MAETRSHLFPSDKHRHSTLCGHPACPPGCAKPPPPCHKGQDAHGYPVAPHFTALLGMPTSAPHTKLLTHNPVFISGSTQLFLILSFSVKFKYLLVTLNIASIIISVGNGTEPTDQFGETGYLYNPSYPCS